MLTAPAPISGFQFSPKTKTRGLAQIYDWDRLLDGNTYVLRRGLNFTVQTATMESLIRTKCRDRGLSYQLERGIEKTGTGNVEFIAIQVTGKLSPEEITKRNNAQVQRVAKRRAIRLATKQLAEGELVKLRQIINQ